MIQNRSFRHKETFNVVFVIPSWWYFLMRYDILWTHEKTAKKMSFAFYLKRYYFDKTRNLSFAKKKYKIYDKHNGKHVYLTHTQSHAIHLDIEQHYHRAFNFFWFFLFIYEIWFAWADITLGNNRESTLRLCYRFRQNNCGLSQSECTLQIQSTNNPTRAHQFRSGGSALHRNACYRMFTCANKFCIKLYMQYAFIVCIILRCLFSPFVVVISMFAWFLRVLLTLYIYFVASLIFPGHTHLIHHINTAKKTNNAAAI